MSFPISFEFAGWDVRDPARICRSIDALVMALAEHNAEYLRRYWVPPLYLSGVRYKAQEDVDVFMDAAAVYRDKVSDCKNLVAWRIAEIVTFEGIPAGALTFSQEVEDERFPYFFHVVVIRGDGIIEDPSRVLGMRSEGE